MNNGVNLKNGDYLKELRTEIYSYCIANNLNEKKQNKLLLEIERKFDNIKIEDDSLHLNSFFGNKIDKTKQFWAAIPKKEVEEVKREAEKFISKFPEVRKNGISKREQLEIETERDNWLNKLERTEQRKFVEKCNEAENRNDFTDRFADIIAADLAKNVSKNAGHRFLQIAVREYLPVLNVLQEEKNCNNNNNAM